MIEKLLRMYETTDDNSVAWLLFAELDRLELWKQLENSHSQPF